LALSGLASGKRSEGDRGHGEIRKVVKGRTDWELRRRRKSSKLLAAQGKNKLVRQRSRLKATLI